MSVWEINIIILSFSFSLWLQSFCSNKPMQLINFILKLNNLKLYNRINIYWLFLLDIACIYIRYLCYCFYILFDSTFDSNRRKLVALISFLLFFFFLSYNICIYFYLLFYYKRPFNFFEIIISYYCLTTIPILINLFLLLFLFCCSFILI